MNTQQMTVSAGSNNPLTQPNIDPSTYLPPPASKRTVFTPLERAELKEIIVESLNEILRYQQPS